MSLQMLQHFEILVYRIYQIKVRAAFNAIAEACLFDPEL